MELNRSDPSAPGITRRRHGRGFRLLDADGRPVPPSTAARVEDLVIPPAWRDVWICPDPDGHIQAVGTDAAGRRQYLYHPRWRERRDREKHDRVLDFAEALPAVRARVAEHLSGRGLTRDRVLAAAVRLIDLGFFRAGGEEYAEENGTFGMATVLREHVTCRRNEVIFEYPAKGAKDRHQAVAEEAVCRVVGALKRRRDDGPELLAYRSPDGGRRDVTSADINAYLREVSGGGFTAKDFRTWHATVLAAVGLAVSTQAATGEAARRRAVSRVVREVADYLGNTPAVARASYIDARVIAWYERGVTVAPALTALGEGADFGELATQGEVERAVVDMLRRPLEGG
ncbi:DNA topoisomerase IB [Thermomonospora catenispora]|uniref:DNA topoisomerase IB n=1 Tax=Thermomonospora catenispora TaxID=2493090 RepID=UPI001120C867|nr:DNA topoisomerase IB [Thermomonospora catenispora]TNY36624.1 DNA topoisomerase IB [Thermomonospora catenispora]